MYEILFQNSAITIRTFNIVLALGFLFSGAFLIKYTNRRMMDLSFLSRQVLGIFIGTLVCGRLFYIFENLSFFKESPLYAVFFWDLKFSFFGIIYGLAGLLYYRTRGTQEDFWAWMDAAGFFLMMMLIFVNVGHFFDGSYYGIPTDLPWAISFDTSNIPFVSPIHPTQLYAALLAFVIWAYGTKRAKRIHIFGVVGARMIMLYSIGMLGIDFLHGAPSLYAKVSYAILAAISLIAMIHCSYRKHLDTTLPPTEEVTETP